VKSTKVLDSFALLAYLNDESGADKIKKLFTSAQHQNTTLLINEINVGESYYIISRRRGQERADYFLETVLSWLSVDIVHNSFDLVIEAAKVKAVYPLSFADCFAAVTAARNDAVLITGDPEFKEVEHMIKVDWL
jgi:uncharacterized protein